ncbi:hypothetical protein VTK56DRAFT_6548 [Thermocarpiscus australiensis]
MAVRLEEEHTVGCCVCGIVFRVVLILTSKSTNSENEGGERRAEVDRAGRARRAGRAGRHSQVCHRLADRRRTRVFSRRVTIEKGDATPRLSGPGVGDRQGHPRGSRWAVSQGPSDELIRVLGIVTSYLGKVVFAREGIRNGTLMASASTVISARLIS